MVETIQPRNGLWHVMLTEKDLVEQAGLNPDDIEVDFGYFRYKGRPVIISHTYGEHLVVSMQGEEDEDLNTLMVSFSKVVEYEPFCKYNLLQKKGCETLIFPTYEWDKVDPDERFDELTSKPTIADLVRI